MKEAIKSLEGEDVTHVTIGWGHGDVEVIATRDGYKIIDDEGEDITPKQVDPQVEINDLIAYIVSTGYTAETLAKLIPSILKSRPHYVAGPGGYAKEIDDSFDLQLKEKAAEILEDVKEFVDLVKKSGE